MIKLPLEAHSHLYVSASLGSHLCNSFQLQSAPESPICHAEGEKKCPLNKTLGITGAACNLDFQRVYSA